MNSPLGKWEQEDRVNKALQDAERLRAQEEAGDASAETSRGGLLVAAGAGLHWLAAHARGTIQSIQMRLAAPAAQKD